MQGNAFPKIQQNSAKPVILQKNKKQSRHDNQLENCQGIRRYYL